MVWEISLLMQIIPECMGVPDKMEITVEWLHSQWCSLFGASFGIQFQPQTSSGTPIYDRSLEILDKCPFTYSALKSSWHHLPCFSFERVGYDQKMNYWCQICAGAVQPALSRFDGVQKTLRGLISDEFPLYNPSPTDVFPSSYSIGCYNDLQDELTNHYFAARFVSYLSSLG